MVVRMMWLSLVVLCVVHLVQASGETPRVFCMLDEFNATCPRGHVVVMKSAMIGLLSATRCATQDVVDQFRCSGDALPVLDSLCSGRRSCRVPVVDIMKSGISPCPQAIRPYLEASYECVQVAHGTSYQCHGNRQLVLDSAPGYISSLTLPGRRYGTNQCPWLIRVAPGQRVQLTLMNFSGGGEVDETQVREGGCQHLAIIRDGEDADRNVCGGRERVRDVYVSDTNELEVEVIANPNQDQQGHFLLKYSAVGCTAPPVPPGASLQRTGDQAVISCNMTKDIYYMRCVDGEWTGGHAKNCSTHERLEGWDNVDYDWTSPLGLMIVIGLGVVIGIILGVLLLAAVMMWMKRHKRSEGGHEGQYADVTDPQGPPAAGESTQVYRQGDPYKMGQYTDIWSQYEPSVPATPLSPRVDKPPHPQRASLDASVPMLSTATLSRPKHSHDSPMFVRRQYLSKTEMT